MQSGKKWSRATEGKDSLDVKLDDVKEGHTEVGD